LKQAAAVGAEQHYYVWFMLLQPTWKDAVRTSMLKNNFYWSTFTAQQHSHCPAALSLLAAAAALDVPLIIGSVQLPLVNDW
jgi:hypothetical protein